MLYPENLFNRVTYTYGKAGDKYNRAGRLALVEDASGGEAYYYGKQAALAKTVWTKDVVALITPNGKFITEMTATQFVKFTHASLGQ